MVLVILLFGFLLRVPYLSKEIIADELTGILGGMAVARTGYPAIYGGELYYARPAAAIMVSRVVEGSIHRPVRTETTTIIMNIS